MRWNVPAFTPDTPSDHSRVRSSSAALRLNVVTRVRSGSIEPSRTRRATRSVSTLVLPAPAPATTQSSGSSDSMASRWATVRRLAPGRVSQVFALQALERHDHTPHGTEGVRAAPAGPPPMVAEPGPSCPIGRSGPGGGATAPGACGAHAGGRGGPGASATSSSTTALKGRPSASHSMGNMEIGVKPGMVFTSLITISSFLAEEDVDASQALDAQRPVRRRRQLLRRRQLSVLQIGGCHRLGEPQHVLVVVVVELTAGDDLAGPRHPHVLVAHQRELELAARHELLEDHVVVELEGGQHGVPERRRRQPPWRRRWRSRDWRA